MTRPRCQLVSLDTTPYYHCTSRCVRRAFLCGEDRYTGRCFDHRKVWLVERLAFLGEIFAIDIAAYAIMNNHYHVVLHIDPARVDTWSNDEVIARWTRLYKGPALIQRWRAGDTLSAEELARTADHVQHFRRQLGNLSRFMACLNEYIARLANKEDNCTGRFWEGRFESQALLDDAALLSSMAYVDLNPIRAGVAHDLLTSDFTSIQDRIRQVSSIASRQSRIEHDIHNRPRLLPFRECWQRPGSPPTLPGKLQDYLDLVDSTGRSVRPDKKGHITQRSPNLLKQLGLSNEQWRLLALTIQKQPILMLNGLDALAILERRAAREKMA